MTDRNVHDAQVQVTPLGRLRTQLTLPSPEGATFDHELSGWCWCQPLVETDLNGDHVFIHRKSLDSPHIEVIQ